MTLQAAVEGELDEAVIRRLATHVGIEIVRVFGKEGKPKLKERIGGYNAAARFSPWVVLVDLDREECAATLRSEWLPDQESLMCFRVAVPQVESWLLADTQQCASMLGVAQKLLPMDADAEEDAKRRVVQLAAKSRWRAIRQGLVPTVGAKRSVGPLYNATLRSFVAERWRPNVAAERSESLGRCLSALAQLKVDFEDH